MCIRFGKRFAEKCAELVTANRGLLYQKNSLCMLFANDARRQLHSVLCKLVTMSGPRASCAVLFLPSYLMGLSCMYMYVYIYN